MKKTIYLCVMKSLHKIIIYIKERTLLIELLGFIILLSFIWIRFIYKRLPRHIPFDLTLLGFLILIMICIFYIYKIYTLIKPSKSSKTINFLYPMLKILLAPLIQLNEFLLSPKIIRNIIKLMLLLIYKLFKIHMIMDNEKYIRAFLFVIPQLIFTTCLILDCFYFKKLYLIYDVIVIITFPLLVQYLLYASEAIKVYDTILLDKYFIIEIISEDIRYTENDWDENGFLKPDRPFYFLKPSLLRYNSLSDYKEYKYLKTISFIDYQVSCLVCDNLLYEYKILFQNERKDVIYFKTIAIPNNLTKSKCNKLLQTHINISFTKDKIISSTERFATSFLNVSLGINIFALICWSYILFVSYPHISMEEWNKLIMFLENYKDILNQVW